MYFIQNYGENKREFYIRYGIGYVKNLQNFFQNKTPKSRRTTGTSGNAQSIVCCVEKQIQDLINFILKNIIFQVKIQGERF